MSAAENNEVEILVVEDNPDDAELTMRALKKNNLANNVFWVKDGAEALDFLFGRGTYAEKGKEPNPKVKLIILDLKLPKIDGREVLRRIKSDEKLKLVPVVVLTSSQDERDIVESYKFGANSYVTKPVEFEKFAQAVAELGMYWLLLNKAPPT
jgi:CheY-like chemotaxis protein